MFSSIPDLITLLNTTIQSDLSLEEMQALFCVGLEIDEDDLLVYMIDSTMTISETHQRGDEILIPNYAAISDLVQLFKNGEPPLTSINQ